MDNKVLVNGKKKFHAYEQVRQSGLTNMFDTTRVIELAKEIADVKMSREDVLHIASNYTALSEKYKVSMVSA